MSKQKHDIGYQKALARKRLKMKEWEARNPGRQGR